MRVDSTHADVTFFAPTALQYVPNRGEVTLAAANIIDAVQQSASTIRFTSSVSISVGSAYAFVGPAGWITPGNTAAAGVLT